MSKRKQVPTDRMWVEVLGGPDDGERFALDVVREDDARSQIRVLEARYRLRFEPLTSSEVER